MRYHRQNPLREYIFKYICKYIQVIARTRLHTNKENSILQRMQPTYPHAAQKDPAMQCSHIRNHDHPIYIQLKHCNVEDLEDKIQLLYCQRRQTWKIFADYNRSQIRCQQGAQIGGHNLQKGRRPIALICFALICFTTAWL